MDNRKKYYTMIGGSRFYYHANDPMMIRVV